MFARFYLSGHKGELPCNYFFWVLFVFVRCLDKATVHKNVKNLLGRMKIVIVIVTVIAEKNKNLNCRPVLRNDFVIGISCHV
jgi:hypothetical protein